MEAFMTTHPPAIAILGAGHGGLALAGYLSRQGHRISLWNRSPERIDRVSALGGVALTLPGAEEVFCPVHLATSDLRAALDGVQHVLIALPACAHSGLARACAPYLRDGQTVLLVPGRTGGSLEFRCELRQASCQARILLGETGTFPFASRTVSPARSVIFGTKNEVLAAALPATNTHDLLSLWKPILSCLRPTSSVLHTGFANFGAILHPTITLMNVERIEGGIPFDFYTQGVTPAVATVLENADRERMRVARAFGVTALSLRDWIISAYGHRGATMQEAVGDNPAYVGLKAPTTIRHRYLLEDVPTGLIPLLELGRAAGLSLPTLQGLAARAGLVLGQGQWDTPRTLQRLGLEGLDPAGVRAFVEGKRTHSGKPVLSASKGEAVWHPDRVETNSRDILSGVMV